MSIHQDLGPRIRIWLHERHSERPDPYPILDEVLSQLPTTPQRRHRWWPFPASTRRSKTMFSTVKFIAAGAIVALFGGFLLSGILTTQQGDEVVPAAATASAVSREAAVFDGTMPYPHEFLPGTVPVLGEGVVTKRGEGWEVWFEDVSDPRLAGTYRNILNEDRYGGVSAVWASASRIDNAEGSWLGLFTGYQDPYQDPDGRRYYHQGILTGTGAYEGLTAVMFLMDTGDSSYDVHGMVFPGDLPEVPAYPEPAE